MSCNCRVRLLCDCCTIVVRLLCDCCAIVVRLLCDWCAIVVRLLCDCCAIVVRLLCDCCAIVVRLLCDCCAIVVRLLYDCCTIVVRLLYDCCAIGNLPAMFPSATFRFWKSINTPLDPCLEGLQRPQDPSCFKCCLRQHTRCLLRGIFFPNCTFKANFFYFWITPRCLISKYLLFDIYNTQSFVSK